MHWSYGSSSTERKHVIRFSSSISTGVKCYFLHLFSDFQVSKIKLRWWKPVIPETGKIFWPYAPYHIRSRLLLYKQKKMSGPWKAVSLMDFSPEPILTQKLSQAPNYSDFFDRNHRCQWNQFYHCRDAEWYFTHEVSHVASHKWEVALIHSRESNIPKQILRRRRTS